MQNMRRMRNWIRPIVVIAWIVFLTLPIGFLLGGASLGGDWFSGIYTALEDLFGERSGKWAFCGLWLVLNVVLFWRLVLSNTRHDDLGDPPNLDD